MCVCMRSRVLSTGLLQQLIDSGEFLSQFERQANKSASHAIWTLIGHLHKKGLKFQNDTGVTIYELVFTDAIYMPMP